MWKKLSGLRSLCFSGWIYFNEILLCSFLCPTYLQERIQWMTNYPLCFCPFWRENTHSVASLWCVSQKQHLLKCGWNREEDRSWAYSTLCNTRIMITYLIWNIAYAAFPEKWKHHPWNQCCICGSFLFFVPVIALDISDKFDHRCCWKAGCLNDRKSSQETYL